MDPALSVICFIYFGSFLIIVVNLLFAILGIVMIVLGTLFHNIASEYYDFLQNYMSTLTILVITLGCVALLNVFLGCCYPFTDNKFLTYLIASIFLLAMAAEIAIASIALVSRGSVASFIDKQLNKTLIESGENEAFEISWDRLQRELKCCGIEGPNDWNQTGLPTPPACCDKYSNDETCTADTVEFRNGCEPAFKDFVNSKIGSVAAVTIITMLLRLLVMVFVSYIVYKRWEDDRIPKYEYEFKNEIGM